MTHTCYQVKLPVTRQDNGSRYMTSLPMSHSEAINTVRMYLAMGHTRATAIHTDPKCLRCAKERTHGYCYICHCWYDKKRPHHCGPY